MTTGGPFHDPRMRGFRSRTSVEAVLALIERRVGRLGSGVGRPRRRPRAGSWPTRSSAESAVPAFDRAAMDGYAVRGEETFGADAYSPIAFDAGRPGPAGPAGGPRRRARPGGRDRHRGPDARRGRHGGPGRGDRVRRPDRPGLRAHPAGPARRPGGARTSPKGPSSCRPGRVLRPQDLGVLSAIGLGSGRGRPPARRRHPRHRRRAAPGRDRARRAPDRRRQLADARGPGRPRRRARPASSARSPTTATRSARRSLEAVGVGRPPADLRRELDRPRGPRPRPGRRAGRAGRPRRRDPAGEPGRAWASWATVPVVLLPGNPVSCLCAYDFFAGPIVRRLGRPAARPGPIGRSSCRSAGSSPRSSAGSITRGSRSSRAGSSRWPSAGPRSSPAPPGPTASWSSPPTSKATRAGRW